MGAGPPVSGRQADREISAWGLVVLGRVWLCAGRRTLGRCSGRTGCRRRDASSSGADTRCRADLEGRLKAESGLVLSESRCPCGHSLRPLRTLSIDRMASEHLRVKKKFLHPLSCEKFRDIVPLDGPRPKFFHPLNRKVCNLYE